MAAVDLSDRVAVVTGAAGGFGRVFVDALLDAGAKVAALDVDAGRLEALAEGRDASRLLTRVTDIGAWSACESAIEETAARFGGVHVLVNNGALGMGVIRDDHMTDLVAIEEIAPDTWDRFTSVNFSGAWYMTRASVDHMKRQRFGRIVTVTTSFFTMLRGRFHPYGPTKAGLEAMAAGHAKEFDGTGITVNVVVPGGPADTAMVPEVSGLERADLVPPAVMAPPVLWLCSDAAGGVTGVRIVAAEWDVSIAPADALARCRGAIAWPDLAQSPVWPGGRPDE